MSRESKQFYAITDAHEIKQVTGLICPNNEGYWWVPELGYSMSVGSSLFENRDDAVEKEKENLESLIKELSNKLKHLK